MNLMKKTLSLLIIAHVTLPNFHIRWLARSVSNRELREALKNYPDATLELDYELHGEAYAPKATRATCRQSHSPSTSTSPSLERSTS